MKESLKGEEGNEGAYAFDRKTGYHSGGKEGQKKNKALTTRWELVDTWKFGTEGPIGPSVPRSKVSVFRLMYISRRREKKDCQRSYHHQSVGILGL
jgi:hypothetical protein